MNLAQRSDIDVLELSSEMMEEMNKERRRCYELVHSEPDSVVIRRTISRKHSIHISVH